MRIMVPRVAAAVSAQETEKLIHMVRVHLEQAGACLLESAGWQGQLRACVT